MFLIDIFTNNTNHFSSGAPFVFYKIIKLFIYLFILKKIKKGTISVSSIFLDLKIGRSQKTKEKPTRQYTISPYFIWIESKEPEKKKEKKVQKI